MTTATVPLLSPFGRKHSAPRIDSLDGLRGLAILLVIVGHALRMGGGMEVVQSAFPGPGAMIRKVTEPMASLGVDLFFVLSGFLITGILLRARGASNYFRVFYARRFLRIFPLYYGTLAVCFLLLPAMFPAWGAQQAQLCHQQGWLWAFGINLPWVKDAYWASNSIQFAHFWSLAVEEHFYLLWPAVVAMLSRRRLLVVCVALLVAAPIIRVVMAMGAVDQTSTGWFIARFTLCRMDSLALGSLVACLAAGPGGIASQARLAKRVGVIAVIAAAIIVLLPRTRWIWVAEQSLKYTFFAFAFAALLVLIAGGHKDSRLVRLFRNRTLILLGIYSYGIYVLHFLIQPLYPRLFPIGWFVTVLHVPLLAVVLQIATMLVAFVLMAAVSWHCYEKHFLSLKRFAEYSYPRPALEKLSPADQRSQI